MVRGRSGSAGRISKLPVFQERIFRKAASPPKSWDSASITSPLLNQILPLNAPLVTLRTEELCERHSSWMMSTRLLLCTPRKPPSSSRPSKDSIQSRKNVISWLVFGFSKNRSIPMA